MANSPFQTNQLPLVSPLPWRGRSPLHKKMGARRVTWFWPNGAGMPLTATPLNFSFLYDASAAIDRVLGVILTIAASGTGCDFIIQDLTTNDFWDYTYPGNTSGVRAQHNIITSAEMANLSIWFTAQLSVNVTLHLTNIELMPFIP